MISYLEVVKSRHHEEQRVFHASYGIFKSKRVPKVWQRHKDRGYLLECLAAAEKVISLARAAKHDVGEHEDECPHGKVIAGILHECDCRQAAAVDMVSAIIAYEKVKEKE